MRRIKLAFDTVGKDKRVMVDANQVFNRNEALRRGRVYQEMGCFWYEEPLPPQEMEGYAELAHALDIRIATGENLATKYAFADLIARRGADVVQPDNRRAGGVTEWMEIAAIADGYGMELASHGGSDTNLNMLLAMPNAIYMESRRRAQTGRTAKCERERRVGHRVERYRRSGFPRSLLRAMRAIRIEAGSSDVSVRPYAASGKGLQRIPLRFKKPSRCFSRIFQHVIPELAGYVIPRRWSDDGVHALFFLVLCLLARSMASVFRSFQNARVSGTSSPPVGMPSSNRACSRASSSRSWASLSSERKYSLTFP